MDLWLSHPATVHIPLALSVILPLAFLATWGGITFKWLSPNSWYFPVAGIWLLAGSSLMAYFTGERAKVFSAADQVLLKSHESIAQFYLIFGAALFFLSTALVYLQFSRFRRMLCILIFIVLLAQAGVALRLGHIGGEIVFG